MQINLTKKINLNADILLLSKRSGVQPHFNPMSFRFHISTFLSS